MFTDGYAIAMAGIALCVQQHENHDFTELFGIFTENSGGGAAGFVKRANFSDRSAPLINI